MSAATDDIYTQLAVVGPVAVRDAVASGLVPAATPDVFAAAFDGGIGRTLWRAGRCRVEIAVAIARHSQDTELVLDMIRRDKRAAATKAAVQNPVVPAAAAYEAIVASDGTKELLRHLYERLVRTEVTVTCEWLDTFEAHFDSDPDCVARFLLSMGTNNGTVVWEPDAAVRFCSDPRITDVDSRIGTLYRNQRDLGRYLRPVCRATVPGVLSGITHGLLTVEDLDDDLINRIANADTQVVAKFTTTATRVQFPDRIVAAIFESQTSHRASWEMALLLGLTVAMAQRLVDAAPRLWRVVLQNRSLPSSFKALAPVPLVWSDTPGPKVVGGIVAELLGDDPSRLRVAAELLAGGFDGTIGDLVDVVDGTHA